MNHNIFIIILQSDPQMSKSVIALLKAFNWKKFVLIVGTRHWSSEVGQAIKELAEINDYEVLDYFEYSDYIPNHIYKMEKIITESYRNTRSRDNILHWK